MSDQPIKPLPTEAEREAFYDAEIAPALAELSRRCTDAGLSMLAVVEFGQTGDTDEKGSNFGRTLGLASGSSASFRWFDAFVRCNANFERYAMSFTRHVVRSGLPHSSMYLEMLGIKGNPEDRK